MRSIWIGGIGALVLGASLAVPVHAAGGGGLEQAMHAMGGAFKVIRRQVNDPSQNADTLQAVDKLEAAILKAKTMYPDTADTAEKKAQYQADMVKLLQAVLTVDADLLANRNDAAAKDLNAVMNVMNQGHSAFRRED